MAVAIFQERIVDPVVQPGQTEGRRAENRKGEELTQKAELPRETNMLRESM